jgi:hypothetical protein
VRGLARGAGSCRTFDSHGRLWQKGPVPESVGSCATSLVMTADEAFWTILLRQIEDRKVIPVVGDVDDHAKVP